MTTISAGGGLPVRLSRRTRSWCDVAAYFELWDAARKRLEDSSSAIAMTLEIEPGRYISAEMRVPGEPRSVAIKTDGPEPFLSCRRRLQQPGPADPLRRLSSDFDLHAGRDVWPLADRPLAEVVVGGPLCESGDIFTQQAGGFVVAAFELPAASGRRFPGDRKGRGVWQLLHVVSNYNSRSRWPPKC